MKTGILSMQRIYNYGSWLQSYALKNIIKEVNSSDVEFVDYRVEKPITAHGKGLLPYFLKSCLDFAVELISSCKPIISVLNYKRITHIYNFKHIYHPRLFANKGINKNYTPELDNLVIGSDEVFNCLQSNPRVGYSPELFGVRSRARNNITYAASFGNTTIEKIRYYGKEAEIASWLNNLDSISVRDNNSYEVVKTLTGRVPEINLDPVLMYDFKNELSQTEDFIGIDEKYLIVYTYPNRLNETECQYIKEYARNKNLKIVGINANYNIVDNMVYDSPLNVLRWFKNAECIITDTFHGTIFSIINHKQFATIIRKSYNGSYGNQEKLHDLLLRLSLVNRVVDSSDKIGALLDTEIDYKNTDNIIVKEREHTYSYLRSFLK